MGIPLGDSKLISAVIPVFNCERYLSEAIESVQRQSYKPIEIIVVDDGSTDRSGEIAKSFGSSITYVLQPHRGIAAARNAGIGMAKGSFFAFLDADDLWTENKVMLQMKVLKENPDVDWVFGHVKQFISPDIDAESGRKIQIPQEVMPGYIPSTVLIRRESFSRVGFFGDTWQIGEFIDWYLRAREQGLKSVMLNEIVSKRRIHDDNIGIRRHAERTDYVRILKSSLDRQRQQRQNQ
jgi:glycosyltransferase involved in cell wall biosynthesis